MRAIIKLKDVTNVNVFSVFIPFNEYNGVKDYLYFMENFHGKEVDIISENFTEIKRKGFDKFKFRFANDFFEKKFEIEEIKKVDINPLTIEEFEKLCSSRLDHFGKKYGNRHLDRSYYIDCIEELCDVFNVTKLHLNKLEGSIEKRCIEHYLGKIKNAINVVIFQVMTVSDIVDGYSETEKEFEERFLKEIFLKK
jgi:hypothetical protein